MASHHNRANDSTVSSISNLLIVIDLSSSNCFSISSNSSRALIFCGSSGIRCNRQTTLNASSLRSCCKSQRGENGMNFQPINHEREHTLEDQRKPPRELCMWRVCRQEVACEAHPSCEIRSQSICNTHSAHHSAASLKCRDLSLGTAQASMPAPRPAMKRQTRNMTIS
jgi:hypothetical protein